MKGMEKIKRTICFVLTFMLIVSSTFAGEIPIFASEKPEKNETVFINLDATGKPRQKIVTDWLHSDCSNIEIHDKTTLKDIENIKSDEIPIQNNNDIIWHIEGNDVYYKGTTEKKPPLDIKIKYYLNNNEILPSDIAGKSGKVKIVVDLKNTDTHEVLINGNKTNIHTPLTVVLVMSFPNETFKNVKIDNGKIISDGNAQIVTFISMPGLKESLNIGSYDIKELDDIEFPESLTVIADAEEFTMGSIGIVATTDLVGIDKLKKSEDIDDMRNNLKDLDKVQNEIDLIDPDKEIRSLFTNPVRTAASKLLIFDIFDFYDMDKELFDIIPNYVTYENIKLYDRVKANLDDVDIGYMLDNKVFRSLNDRLTDENIEKSKTLVNDYDELKEFDMKRFDRVTDILDDYDDVHGIIVKSDKLKDKLKKNKTKLDTLDALSGFSKDAIDLLDYMNSSGLMNMSDEDLNIMLDAGLQAVANKKSGDISSQYKSLIGEDGQISEENRPIIINFVNKAMEAGSITSPTAIAAINAIKLGNVGNPPELHNMINKIVDGCIQSVAYDNISDTKSKVKTLIRRADSLESRVHHKLGGNYKNDIKGASNFIDDIMPDVRELRDEYKKQEDKVENAFDLIKDEDDVAYFTKWSKTIKTMKTNLDDNDENLEVLRDLLNEYEDPKIKHFKKRFADLQNDIDDTRPILKSLKDDLDTPILNESLHKSPETTKQLLKMKKDLEDNRKIAEILRTAMDDKNVVMANDVIDILEDLQNKNIVEDYLNKIDNVDELLARKDELVKLSDDYNIFTDAGDNMTSNVKFVFKTDEIEKPEVKEEVIVIEKDKPNFFKWCIDKFKKIFNR